MWTVRQIAITLYPKCVRNVLSLFLSLYNVKSANVNSFSESLLKHKRSKLLCLELIIIAVERITIFIIPYIYIYIYIYIVEQGNYATFG